jgi:pyrroloquinoline quinone biosynthesis protein B
LAALVCLGCAPVERSEQADGVEREQERTVMAGASTVPSGPFVRVLGTAQDGGLPHAACTCERCELARHDPEARRLISSLALVLPGSDQVYLIDATPDVRAQLDLLADVRRAPRSRVDRRPVDGVFLTHAHIGHYLGLAFFGFEAVHTSELPLMVSPRMADFLRRNGPWSQLVELRNIELRELTPGTPVALEGGVSVTAVSAPHRDEYADTLGFVIAGPNRRIFYLPDTDSWQAWTQSLPSFLEGVDVAVLDGTFFSLNELSGRSVESIGHPLIQQSMDLLEDLVAEGRTEIYFTHLNHSNPAVQPDSQERQVIESRGFKVLGEGQEIVL